MLCRDVTLQRGEIYISFYFFPPALQAVVSNSSQLQMGRVLREYSCSFDDVSFEVLWCGGNSCSSISGVRTVDVQTRLIAVSWRQRCMATAAAAAAGWSVISRLSGLPGARSEKQSGWKTPSGEDRLGVMCFQCPVGKTCGEKSTEHFLLVTSEFLHVVVSQALVVFQVH